MKTIEKLAERNNVKVHGRRYTLSKLISESYKTLYNCEVNSPMYKLTESLIESIQENPSDIDNHSKDLETLKAIQEMGDEADFDMEEPKEEEELPTPEDLDEEAEEEEIVSPEVPVEEEEEIEVAPEVPAEDDPSISPEELDELRKHLKEMRRARMVKESKTSKRVKESSWSNELSTMSAALKSFRESSNKKAFYKSLSKLEPRLQKDSAPLSIQESIALYKSTNSAMTHLAVELEHNPGFIYTFRECSAILVRDNESLLECISSRKSPSKKLVESFRNFASILLESESIEDEEDTLMEENDGVNLEKEDDENLIEGDGVNLEKEDDENLIENDGVNLEKEDDEDLLEGDGVNLEKEDDEDLLEGDGVNLEKEDDENLIENEECTDDEECPPENIEESEDEEELPTPDDEDDRFLEEDEITDEEAEELKRYLKEIRKCRSK